jgi:tRNA-2-methylthio-N6-dimethylallyladenosine synthase
MTQRKVHIETWGCQMNVADSERMLALLTRQNFVATTRPEEADLIILNTCNIREKARHKVITRLGELRLFKRERPGLLLALSGCVAQVEAQELARELPFLDLVFGPDHIDDLPNLLARTSGAISSKDGSAATSSGTLIETAFSESGTYSIPFDMAEPWLDTDAFEASRFVNIIKGCNNFCSYCVVPYTRGREKSRPTAEIVQEIEFLMAKGIKEIVLLGQNVNSYGLDVGERRLQDAGTPEQTPFVDLLYQVGAISGVERLRFVTSNPHDFPIALPQAFRDIPQLCDQLHLPAQSGSNAVLQRMERKYSREQYLERLALMRAARPEIALSGDFIVGFPGETDADFEATLSLVREARYASIFAFKYSPRRLTKAAEMDQQIPERVKDERLQELLKIQKEETERQNRAEVGKVRSTMILYRSSKEPTCWYGRTFAGRLVKVRNIDGKPGLNVDVRINTASAIALEGTAETPLRPIS